MFMGILHTNIQVTYYLSFRYPAVIIKKLSTSYMILLRVGKYNI